MSTNPITGDLISTRFGNKEAQEKFDESFDKIFGSKKKTNGGWTPPPLPNFDEERIDVIGQNGNDGDHYDK
jgi:hypothetical protein